MVCDIVVFPIHHPTGDSHFVCFFFSNLLFFFHFFIPLSEDFQLMPAVVTTWSTTLNCGTPTTIEVLESRNGLLPECSEGAATLNDTSNKYLLIFFCGNPGIVYFYKSFVEILHARNIDVLVMGYAGHSIVDVSGGRYYLLQQQIDLADQFCRSVLHNGTVARYKKCTFGGHSIGAYVALQMTNRFPSVIHRCFLLTPTICNMEISPHGKSKKAFLKRPIIHVVCATVIPILSLLPESWKDFIVRHTQRDLDVNGRWVSKQMVRPSMICNMLMMAKSEFEEVRTLDVPMLSRVEDKLVGYFVKKDGWVPLTDYDAIVRNAPNAVAMVLEEDENVLHAWCLHHTVDVVEKGIMPYL